MAFIVKNENQLLLVPTCPNDRWNMLVEDDPKTNMERLERLR